MIQKNKIEQLTEWVYKFALLLLGVMIGAFYAEGAFVILLLVFGSIVFIDLISELNMGNKR